MGRRSRLKKQRKLDGQPYLRENPMSSVLHEVWRETCEKGFALYGRGVLYRSLAVGLGQSAYVPLARIDDPVGKGIVQKYNPAKEFVVAEPNEKGGTRWQIFQK
jgi:hypothetical protein